MLTSLFLLAGGLVLLVVGGEFLVRGSVQVAERLGVSPLLIGLTLVGFGTSMPELVTSVEASLVGAPGIALGNIVGSNIANIFLVIGLSAMIFPLRVGASALKRDGSFVIATALLFALAGYTIGLDRIAGAIFLLLLGAYMAYAYRQESQPLTIEETGHTAAFDKGEAVEQVDKTLHGHPRPGLLGWLLPIGIALSGLALIILGGRILVDAAVQLSRALGLSEAVIGLTVVAVGTSLPEFVTSVVAAFRRQADIAVGNVLGSNIYNILGIGGVTGLIAPTMFPPEMLEADLFVMMAASILLFLFAWNGKVSRLEGLVLLSAYAAYTAYLLTR
ncbi:calcium/sodium antiporter [Thermaurantiacus sp.]